MLQPRVTPSLPIGRARDRSSSASSPGRSGIDPYAFAVSDVYQDLFGEGSYTGKGIYDVDAFEAALAGRIPENTHPEPRSARGHLRAGRPGLRHRGRRGISRRATTSPRRASIAGRAATGSCCRGSSAAGRDSSGAASRPPSRGVGRWKMLDNLRRTLCRARALLCAASPAGLLPLALAAAAGPPSSLATLACPRSSPSSAAWCRAAAASRSAATCARSAADLGSRCADRVRARPCSRTRRG